MFVKEMQFSVVFKDISCIIVGIEIKEETDMIMLNCFVRCSNEKAAQKFIDACESRGDVKNIGEAREWLRTGGDDSEVVNFLCLNAASFWNRPAEVESRGGYNITYGVEEWALLKNYPNLQEWQPPVEEGESVSSSPRGELPMSLREYYIGEVLKSTISADSCALSSPTLAAKRIVGIVDAVITEMNQGE